MPAEQVEQIVAAAQSYEHWMATEFDRAHDHFKLVGEDNFRRYLPLREVRVRVHQDDSLLQLFARVLAARTSGCHVVVSSPPELPSTAIELLETLTTAWAAQIEFVQETDDELAAVVHAYQRGRVRFSQPDRVPTVVRKAAAELGVYIADQPVQSHGRIELLWYFQEQSLTHLYHRYGNLGSRSREQRAEVL